MWKKYYITVLLSCLALLTFSACSQEEFKNANEIGKGNLSLTFSCFQPTSKALPTEEGSDIWNENKITRLDCFFYKSTDTDDAEAAHHMYFTSLNVNKTVTVRAQLGESVIKDLFGDKTTCRIYVIANLPEKVVSTLNAKSSINTLKETQVTASFAVNTAQTSFVMDSDGLSVVTYDKSNKTVTGNVPLQRTAAKITLSIVDVEGNVADEKGQKWNPNLKGMYVALFNGVANSSIDSDKFPHQLSPIEHFEFENANKIPLEKNTETGRYEQTVPFYSYAADWKDAGKEVYLVLIVPWSPVNDSNTFKNCYYQIPVNSVLKNLKRNHHYKIDFTVGALGTFDEIKPILVHPSYKILDWGTREIITDLYDFKYLIVTPTKYVMNNQNELSIPYVTSDPIEIVNIQCTRPNLSKFIVSTDIIPNDAFSLTFDESTRKITYNKILDNNFESNTFDFTPYTIKFTVRHKDAHEFKEDVEIIQYPAVYAVHETNSDFVSENNTVAENNTHHGYMFVNGYYSKNRYDHYDSATDELKRVQDFFASAAALQGFATNTYCPNRFVFTVSSVEGTDYIIGDPRVKEPDENLRHAKCMYHGDEKDPAWVQAPSMEGGERGLENYYPTDGSEATRKVIAPRFRLASTYGGLYPNVDAAKSLDGMRKRCASYQEDGYPAGRWRVPTEAEFKFILTMVNKQMIPPVFVLDQDYWCAHGLGLFDSATGTVNITTDPVFGKDGSSVRCVYDEWYWNDKLPDDKKGVFTWGDKPRINN